MEAPRYTWTCEPRHDKACDMILSKKRVTKELISLSRCASWFAPLLLANLKTGFLGSRPIWYMSANHFRESPSKERKKTGRSDVGLLTVTTPS